MEDKEVTEIIETVTASEESLFDWYNDLPWGEIRYRVRKLQKKIALATKMGDWERVKKLQKLTLHSHYCKLYAVSKTVKKKSRRTAGIDGIFWYDDTEKYHKAMELDYRNYTPVPFKRTDIPKDHDKTKLRPLSVPAIFDRAMQNLYLISLKPIIETIVSPTAFGFRDSRGSLDAIRYMTTSMRMFSGNWFVLKADIKECFDHVSHGWLMDNLPLPKKLIKSFLKSGYIKDGKQFEMHEGVAQGGVISPYLIVYALDGFEKILTLKYPEARMMCFADDFLFTGTSREMMENILVDFKEFLKTRNFTISEHKTKIVTQADGFEFIGWYIRRENEELKLTPVPLSKEEFKTRILNTYMQSMNWSFAEFITKVNGIVRGWGNYHRYGCTDDNFVDLDDYVEELVGTWLKIHHKELTMKEIRQMFYDGKTYREGDFALEKLAVPELRIPLKRPVELDIHKNPFLDEKYFREREKMLMENKILPSNNLSVPYEYEEYL